MRMTQMRRLTTTATLVALIATATSLVRADEGSICFAPKADPVRAIEDCTRLLETAVNDKRRSVVLVWRANAYIRKKDVDSALADYNEAINANSYNSSAFEGRSLAYTNSGKNDRALSDIDEAIRLERKAAYLLDRARLYYYGTGNPRSAAQDFDMAVQLAPTWARAYRERGIYFSQEKKYDEAIKDYDASLRIDPTDRVALTERGLADVAKKDVKTQEDYIQALIASLQFQKRYPPQAVFNSMAGRVIVSFTLSRNGDLLDKKVITSSNYPILDNAALEMLDRTQPYRSFWDGAPDHMTFTLPVSFRLEEPISPLNEPQRSDGAALAGGPNGDDQVRGGMNQFAGAQAEQERKERVADEERQLAIAKAVAEKAQAEAEEAKALAAVETAKAQAAADAEVEKAKAAAAAEKARADADRATAEAEKAKLAQEEKDKRNSWTAKLGRLFSSTPTSVSKFKQTEVGKRLLECVSADGDLSISEDEPDKSKPTVSVNLRKINHSVTMDFELDPELNQTKLVAPSLMETGLGVCSL